MKKKCKKVLILILLLVLCSCNFSVLFAEELPIQLTANSAILIDNRTNKILLNKNENEKMYPASTTKILTAILTIEHCNLDDIVTASYDAVMSIPDGYSSANIQIGEQFTVEQLLQMLLVYSANDAANVLAEHVGGSIDSFISMMNTKLNELQLENSHFTNAYGKHDENHYTTAYDLARLLQYCLKNETFRKLAGSASCAIPATNKSQSRLYKSTNELLIPNSKNYYQYLTTGKTGYTSQAKECLVSSAYKNDLEFICVVLGSSNRFDETKQLYEYGFSHYMIKNVALQNDIATQIEVANGTKNTRNLDLLINENIPALIKTEEQNNVWESEIILNDNLSAPIIANEVVGKVKYEIDGIEYTTDLIASHDVVESKLLKYIIYIGIAFIILFLFYEFFHSNGKKNKKYRRK